MIFGHVIPLVPVSLALIHSSLHSLGEDDQNKVQYDNK